MNVYVLTSCDFLSLFLDSPINGFANVVFSIRINDSAKVVGIGVIMSAFDPSIDVVCNDCLAAKLISFLNKCF